MKKLIPILFLFAFSLGQLWAQENLDFLDKVNEKPKTTTPVKVKEEPVTTNKKTAVATVTSKKKKSKKKKSLSNTQISDPISPTTNINSNTTQIQNPISSELKSLPVISEPIKKEEEIVMNGLWVDAEVSVEPDGLPGFGSDLSFGKTPNIDDSKGGTQLTTASKPLFSFSEFFDKYKKAMMILGIIILFAFYRLRMAKPSSSSRPYRR